MAETPINIAPQPVRCAIYTRKSSEEGLEQEFNSLDAQREAAEAFISSQRQQGWLALSHQYNDGGCSGANLDRAALRRLLTDIEAGRVDSVIVYKVDRLSRSLVDFARLMSVFEQHGITFVSVTQQFNTSTPVGRLTLHILLSFAQFERELISERTRDKKAAAKRKGKWTGGYVPLGYDLHPDGGKLVINEREAEQVRSIFARFVENRSLEMTVDELRQRGSTTKSWITEKQNRHEGRAFTEQSLRRLLTNECYAGLVEYRGQTYRGEQGRIVPPRLWTRVQAMLQTRNECKRKPGNKYNALLYGLLYCSQCNKPMAHTSTQTSGRRYRYYVCRSKNCGRQCLRADAFEASVIDKLGASVSRSVPDEVRPKIAELVSRVSYDSRQGDVAIQLRVSKENRNV